MMVIDLDHEDRYFGNTTTPAEEELLATLPREEARALAKTIAARNIKRFPAAKDRLSGTPEELFRSFETPPVEDDPDWLKD